MIKVVPNWVILIAVVLAFAVSFGATFWFGHRAGGNAAELEYAKKENKELIDASKRERELRIALEKERERLREVSSKLQTQLNVSGEVHENATKVITREVEKPVYRDLGVPASGVQLLSETARQLNATRSPAN